MKKLLTLTAIIGTIVLGFYFYFHNVGRVRASVNEIFITSADVPDAFDGARIVQISDLFVRREGCLELLEYVVTTVNDLRPDIVIFTGNLFSPEGVRFEESVTALLDELSPGLMKLAVFGYHDLHHYELTSSVLEGAGFELLNNQSRQVFDQSPIGINVIGSAPTNNWYTMEQLLDIHVLNESFNLLLMSVPTFSTVAFNYEVQVQLSGHCLARQDATSPTASCFQFYDGTYQFADQFTLHVSSGLARFHIFSNLFRQPSIDSFLLRQE